MIFICLVLLGVIVWLTWKLSRMYQYCSILNQCISDMLVQPRAAEKIATETRKELIELGHVKE